MKLSSGKKQVLKSKQVSVFGNPVDPTDSLVVGLVPELEKRFPGVHFSVEDPTETLEPETNPWIILDVGIGINEVVVVEDLAELDFIQGQSVHDFDVYMELRLREKLGQLPTIKIIIVPMVMDEEKALTAIETILSQLI
jgi:hypothetical protein